MGKRLFRLPGSYTVEAVFLMPMIIFLLAFVLYVSMDWYESVEQTAGSTEVIQQLDTRAYFLDIGEWKAVRDLLSSQISG